MLQESLQHGLCPLFHPPSRRAEEIGYAEDELDLEESPEVAIIQHASGVTQVINSLFENLSRLAFVFDVTLAPRTNSCPAVTYFANLVYLSIKLAVGDGDKSPFVGHNAFLLWKSLQSLRFKDQDGRELC